MCVRVLVNCTGVVSRVLIACASGRLARIHASHSRYISSRTTTPRRRKYASTTTHASSRQLACRFSSEISRSIAAAYASHTSSRCSFESRRCAKFLQRA